MAASVSPKKRIEAGTQATDGSDCSPLTIGPMPRRTTLERAISSPSGVPIATAATKPVAPRCRLVAMASNSCPAFAPTVWSRMLSATSPGDGSAYGSRQPDR
jgi:hypothetical protein